MHEGGGEAGDSGKISNQRHEPQQAPFLGSEGIPAHHSFRAVTWKPFGFPMPGLLFFSAAALNQARAYIL
jgi:hypothetical protein